jgi:hypothetical protein
MHIRRFFISCKEPILLPEKINSSVEFVMFSSQLYISCYKQKNLLQRLKIYSYVLIRTLRLFVSSMGHCKEIYQIYIYIYVSTVYASHLPPPVSPVPPPWGNVLTAFKWSEIASTTKINPSTGQYHTHRFHSAHTHI